jgi:hypothetical protein
MYRESFRVSGYERLIDFPDSHGRVAPSDMIGPVNMNLN